MGIVIDYQKEAKKNKEDKNEQFSYICAGISLIAGYTAYKITKKDLKARCSYYKINPMGIGFISYAVAQTIGRIVYREADTTVRSIVAAINTIKEGEDHGGSETGGYQTEQSQEQGDDFLE